MPTETPDDRLRMLGGSSGEQEARMALLMALGEGWTLTHTVDRDTGDELRLGWQGHEFVVTAPRLRMRVEQA